MLARSGLGLSRGDLFGPGDRAGCFELVARASSVADPGQAVQALRTVEVLDCPVEVKVRAMQVYRDLGMPREALRMASTLPAARQDPGVMAAVAWSWWDLREADSAKAAFRRAATLPGAAPATVKSLAWLALQLGETGYVGPLLERAVHLFPEDPDLWRAASEFRLLSKDPPGALEAARKGLALAPQSSRLLVAQAWALEALADTQAAMVSFRKAWEGAPLDPVVNFELGRFLRRARRYEEAVPYLERATEGACPVEWLLFRATVLAEAGRRGEARAVLGVACARFPSDHRPYLELARWERRAGNTAEARRLLDLAYSLAPQDSAVRALARTLE